MIGVRDPVTRTSMSRILVVENDHDLRDMLQRTLTAEGHHVIAVADQQAGLYRSLTDRFDVAIIDHGVPAIDGLGLIRRIRARGIITPIMVLASYGSVSDRVAGLDAGAEDYLIKPFDIDELLARIRALIRRNTPLAETVAIGDFTVDFANRQARRSDGFEVELSGRECALLHLLSGRPARVFGRENLRQQVFAQAESDSIVDTYVHYLRRKLGKNIITTIRGRGYRLGP